jgi:hypothetical protein
MKSIMAVAVVTLVVFAAEGVAAPNKVKRHVAGIQDQFIVVLPAKTPTQAVEGIARSLAGTYNLTLKTVWPYSLKGFLCNGAASAIDAMAQDPRVEYAEQDVDSVVYVPASGTQYTWYDPTGGTNYQYLWFLDRLDEVSWANRDGLYNMCPEGRIVFETPTRVVRQEFRVISPDSQVDDIRVGRFF